MDVSVIFATHNREDVLGDVFQKWSEVLEHTGYEFEIICSDDESTDGTVEIIEKASANLPIILIKNKKGGAGKARNEALKIAKGKIIIFTGDDMFPSPDFINKHYENYLKYGDKVATLGRIRWHGDIELNHLMRHITEIGCEQFGFVALPPYQLIDFRHFYTSNISVSKKMLDEQKIHFSSQFDKYGFEDIELGYRLQKNGMKILYDPSIVIEHYHIYESVDKFCVRQQNAGEELVVFNSMHSDLECKCICDIENCKNSFSRYKENCKVHFSIAGEMTAVIVQLAKGFTRVLEKMIKRKEISFARKLCSIIYADLFQYSFFYGCTMRIAEETKTGKSQINRFTYQYLKKPYSQIYWDIGYGYNEIDSRKWKCWDEGTFILEHILPENICELRISPLKNRCLAWVDSILFERKDGSTRKAEIFWHNSCNNQGEFFDFTNTDDPQIIIREIKNNDYKIKVKMKVKEMEKRGIVKAVKRCLKKVYHSLKNNEKRQRDWNIEYSYGEARKIQIGIIYENSREKQSMIEKYRKATAIFDDSVCISDAAFMQRGYSDYLYAPSVSPLEDVQFRQVIYMLLNNVYDYVMVSNSYENFPNVSCRDINDVFIYSSLLQGETISKKCKNSVGRFLRLPFFEQSFPIISLKDCISNIEIQNDFILKCSKIGMPEFRISRRRFTYEKSRPVIFVIPVFLAVGGVERNTIETMRSLKEEYDFCLITMERHTLEQGSLHYQLKGICEYIFDLKELVEFENYLDIFYELKNIFSPDLIWLCNNSPWLEEHLLQFRKVFSDVPIVFQDVYDTEVGWIQYYDRPAIQTVDRFIAVTQLIRDTFLNKYKIAEDRVDVIYSLVDAERIKQVIEVDKTNEEICKEYALDIQKKHFAFVGRLTEQKNPIRYLELVKEAAAYMGEELEFILVGDGACCEMVDNYINEMKMSNAVKRIPFVANTPEFIKMLDGLIMTSRYEGMPIVTIEAMSVSTPVLSTDVGDLKRFLNQTSGGMLIDETKTDFENFKEFYDNLDYYKMNAKKHAAEMLQFFSADEQKKLYQQVFLKGITAYKKEEANG